MDHDKTVIVNVIADVVPQYPVPLTCLELVHARDMIKPRSLRGPTIPPLVFHQNRLEHVSSLAKRKRVKCVFPARHGKHLDNVLAHAWFAATVATVATVPLVIPLVTVVVVIILTASTTRSVIANARARRTRTAAISALGNEAIRLYHATFNTFLITHSWTRGNQPYYRNSISQCQEEKQVCSWHLFFASRYGVPIMWLTSTSP